MPAGTRVDELESAVRTVCEPIFNKPLKEISFAQVLLRLFETARRFDMQIQPQLILLQKTLFNIEGLGRELYPELDLWKTARPMLRSWMRERMSPRAVLRRMRTQLPDAIEALKQVPQLVQTTVRAAAEGRLVLEMENTGDRPPCVMNCAAPMSAEIRLLPPAVLWLSALSGWRWLPAIVGSAGSRCAPPLRCWCDIATREYRDR